MRYQPFTSTLNNLYNLKCMAQRNICKLTNKNTHVWKIKIKTLN